MRLITTLLALFCGAFGSATILAIAFEPDLGFVPIRPLSIERQPAAFIAIVKNLRFDLDKDGFLVTNRSSGVPLWDRSGCIDAKSFQDSILLLLEGGRLESVSLSGKRKWSVTLSNSVEWLAIDPNGRYVLGASKKSRADNLQGIYLFDLLERSLIETSLETDIGHFLEHEIISFDNLNALVRIGDQLHIRNGSTSYQIRYPHSSRHMGILDSITVWRGKSYALFRSYMRTPNLTTLIECTSGDIVYEYNGEGTLQFVMGSPANNFCIWLEYRENWRVIELLNLIPFWEQWGGKVRFVPWPTGSSGRLP